MHTWLDLEQPNLVW